jgi:hypothetical protein
MFDLLTREINLYATGKFARRTKCSLCKDPLIVTLTPHIIAQARSFLPCLSALQTRIPKNEISLKLFHADFLSMINFRLRPW